MLTDHATDVVAEHVHERTARRRAAMAARNHDSRINGTALDEVLEGDDVIDIVEPNHVEVETFAAESLRTRARRLDVEAATGVSTWSGDDGRLRYLGRMAKGTPPRRDIDDQDLAFAIDELQRARIELAVAYDRHGSRLQRTHAISRSLDRVRFALGFALDLLDRHEALT